MKLLFISVVALCLAGCATEAVLPSQAKQAPKERLLKFQSPGVGEQAKLIVVRDKGFLGSGCFVGVYLNQEKAAILDPGEKAEFYLKPGEWNVALMGEGRCASLTRYLLEETLCSLRTLQKPSVYLQIRAETLTSKHCRTNSPQYLITSLVSAGLFVVAGGRGG